MEMYSSLIIVTFATIATAYPQSTSENKKPTIGGCKFPPDPPHGRYVLVEPLIVEPGQKYDGMTLRLICDPGYGIFSSLRPLRRDRVGCHLGYWPWSFSLLSPVCERFCELPKDEHVEYRCIVPPPPSFCWRFYANGNIGKESCPIPEGLDKGYRICDQYEQNGTVVQPVCKKGKYTVELSNATEEVPRVTCESGTWNRRSLDPCTPS